MNVNRSTPMGKVDPNDRMNKSQIYITSAGFKSHFSYKKQIQLLVWQMLREDKSFVMGGSWRTPVYMGLLDRGFVNDLKADGGPKCQCRKKFFQYFLLGFSNS